MPTIDPYESMDPDDFEPTPRPRWIRLAALACLLAALLLIVISI